MTDIVLCATQRCGSTMIVEDMRNIDILGRPEEWFIPWSPGRADADWPEEMERVRRWGQGPNGVFAVKVMANQLAGIEACLKTMLPASSERPFHRFHTIFQEAIWVWLRRDDIVLQAVSRVVSQQTGINHATDGADHFAGNLMKGGDLATYNASVQYSYEAILRESTSITLENLAWSRFFEAFGITPLVITYEEAVRDADMTHLDEIVRRARVSGAYEKSPRRLVKLGNSLNTEFAERFHREAAQRGFR
jgi:LPS sulfotransferase NodH